MKKKLFNIHRLIGINAILVFFISLFFGILTIYSPYLSLWEDSSQHIKYINNSQINYDKCINEISKIRTTNKTTVKRDDFFKFNLPGDFKSQNLIYVFGKEPFLIHPITCEKVSEKPFELAHFFTELHYGNIFDSILIRIFFGFISVSIIFLCLSGIFLLLKNKYKNKNVTTTKSLFSKYHRLLLVYTLPLVFMFGLTGALFNLGVYSSPILTSFVTHGETNNILKTNKNILRDPDLISKDKTKFFQTLNINALFNKAQTELKNTVFYQIQIANYNDINARIKFIGYEPKSFFISSTYNESYIILNATNAKTIDVKTAKEGTFTEKTLDSIFYLHYLKTFSDFARNIFALICIVILFGVVSSMLLWLLRAKKDRFTFRVLKPLSFTIILGSIFSSSLIICLNWIVHDTFETFTIFDKKFFTLEIVFYFSYICLFFVIQNTKSIYKTTQLILISSAILLLSAVVFHSTFSMFSIFDIFNNQITDLFKFDLVLFIYAIFLYIGAKKLSLKHFDF